MNSVRSQADMGLKLRVPGGRSGRQLLSLLRSPGLAGRCVRVFRREWSAGGLRGVLSHLGRLMAAQDGVDVTAVSYEAWIAACDTLTDADRAAIVRHIDALSSKPLISVVVPVYDAPEPMLRAMIASVQGQLYSHWELCLADDASPSPHVARVLADCAASDPRIRWVRREVNGHISAASNSALALARGEFVALLDHDDILSERALYEIVVAHNADPAVDLIYSDEDKIDENDERYGPYFKPAFSHELLLGQNMISHFGVYRRSVLEAVGGFRVGYEGSQDYDLALRVVAHSGPSKVSHVPAVLYHWRQARAGTSFSQSRLDRCIAVARQAIQDHIDHAAAEGRDLSGTVAPSPLIPTWSRVAWALPSPAPLVSIIVSADAGPARVAACVEGLLNGTDYPAIEILVASHGVQEASAAAADPRLRTIDHDGAVSGAAWSNLAARAARGDVLLLIDSAVDVTSADWLTELVGVALRPGVGIAGAKLLLPDGRVHHAGLRLWAGTSGEDTGGHFLVGHFGRGQRDSNPGYFGHQALARDVSAVTGACLAIRKPIYDEVGGLDERNLTRAFHDVDLCLRVRAAGYRVLWTPFSVLRHQGSVSEPADCEADVRHMVHRWGDVLADDPFHNVNFDPGTDLYHLATPLRRRQPWSDWLHPEA